MPNRDLRRSSRVELENMATLGPDDTFPFRCKRCGKCCTYVFDAICTPEDLFRIAVYLHRQPQHLLERYFMRTIYAGLPAIQLASGIKCAFLMGKKCVVHEAKPLACRVYPLAQLYKGDNGPPGYVFRQVACHKQGAPLVKVRDWIGEFAQQPQMDTGRVWTDLGIRLSCTFQQYRQSHSLDEVAEAAAIIFKLLYLEYDTSAPFLPQLIKNRDALERVLEQDFGMKVVDLEEALRWERMQDQAAPNRKEPTYGEQSK